MNVATDGDFLSAIDGDIARDRRQVSVCERDSSGHVKGDLAAAGVLAIRDFLPQLTRAEAIAEIGNYLIGSLTAKCNRQKGEGF